MLRVESVWEERENRILIRDSMVQGSRFKIGDDISQDMKNGGNLGQHPISDK